MPEDFFPPKTESEKKILKKIGMQKFLLPNVKHNSNKNRKHYNFFLALLREVLY